MKIYILFGWRIGSYDGEFAPEPLEVIGEYVYDENPTWIWEKKAEYEKTHDFQAVQVIPINVDGRAIENLLMPSIPVEGKVLTPPDKVVE